MKNNILPRLATIIICLNCLLMGVKAQKTLETHKIESKITIDGILDEVQWQDQTNFADGFKTTRPKPGLDPAYPTIVKVLYDDDALYISAIMHEGGRDSISTELLTRDQIGNTDFFGVIIDTYGNSNNAFEFILSSTNVQFDAQVTPNNEDSNWDAVWFGQVQLSDDQWVAEIKIPYSAIRFPKQTVQDWRINFFRRRSISGEQSVWADFDPEMSNPWLTQMGNLTGVKDIKPPVRLSLSPYASVYAIHAHNKDRSPINSIGSSYNLGLDVKYGISDAFTLDMTLIPDFGQVQTDDVVLNLSPFEQRFAERRPFFTEGTEIFEKGNLFYSRRVGQNQQLYNATKISGRTKKGTGIGVFNAVAAEKFHLEDDPESEVGTKHVDLPLTNYNIFVFDQDLKNNSSLAFTNTNVWRRGNDFHNANVSAVTYVLKNKAQSYGINGTTAVSQLLHPGADNSLGYNINTNISKINGNLIGGLYYRDISKNYDANDLGYTIQANQRLINLYGTYRFFEGFGPWNNFFIFSNVSYARNVKPNAFSNIGANLGFYGQLKSQSYFNLWTNWSPKSNDFYEPRAEDRFYQLPAYFGSGISYTTDNRKKFLTEIYGNAYKYNAEGWFNYTIGTFNRMRFNNKFNVFTNISYSNIFKEVRYADRTSSDIIFGQRDRKIISNVVGANYTFNDKLGVTFRLRHYWSRVDYKDYFQLNANGTVSPTDYSNHNDLSYNAFSIDLNLNWRFAPGSEFNIVWKNNISGVHNDVFTDFSNLSYTQDFTNLSNLPQTNSVSARVVYFLDYNSVKRQLTRN